MTRRYHSDPPMSDGELESMAKIAETWDRIFDHAERGENVAPPELVQSRTAASDDPGIIMPARHRGTCRCGRPIIPGDIILVRKGQRTIHDRCR